LAFELEGGLFGGDEQQQGARWARRQFAARFLQAPKGFATPRRAKQQTNLHYGSLLARQAGAKN
jgi:hypothetical protein